VPWCKPASQRWGRPCDGSCVGQWQCTTAPAPCRRGPVGHATCTSAVPARRPHTVTPPPHVLARPAPLASQAVRH
jgi:hypothetical protein